MRISDWSSDVCSSDLVAVSGGPDSMALLWLMATLLPGQICAATVDHGLRKGSADEARMVAGFCAREHIPHAILHPAAPISGSLQAAARAERYRLLEQWREAHRSEEHTSELQSLMRIS